MPHNSQLIFCIASTVRREHKLTLSSKTPQEFSFPSALAPFPQNVKKDLAFSVSDFEF